MRVIVYGAGAIGGVLGAHIAEAGTDVVLVARGDHARAIRTDGLVVEDPAGSRTVELPVVESPAEVELDEDDVVMLAMKSHDTPAALDALRAVGRPELPIVCVQNGVENERLALRTFERVYGVTVMCPAAHLDPGVVQAFSSPVPGILDVGRYPSGVDDLAETMAALFERARFVSLPRPDILRWKYAKLLLNLGNAVEAVCGPGARLGRLAAVVRDEGTACLEAAGIDFASEAEDVARRGDILRLRPIDGLRREGGSSFQSLQRARGTIETDYLNGEIVLLGRLHGFDTPANALLQQLATDMARSYTRPGSIAEEEVLRRLGIT